MCTCKYIITDPSFSPAVWQIYWTSTPDCPWLPRWPEWWLPLTGCAQGRRWPPTSTRSSSPSSPARLRPASFSSPVSQPAPCLGAAPTHQWWPASELHQQTHPISGGFGNTSQVSHSNQHWFMLRCFPRADSTGSSRLPRITSLTSLLQ